MGDSELGGNEAEGSQRVEVDVRLVEYVLGLQAHKWSEAGTLLKEVGILRRTLIDTDMR